jgi:hypothetical protein
MNAHSRLRTIASALLALSVMLLAASAETLADPPADVPYVKGVSWGWVGSRGDFASPEAAASMKKLAETGAEWVCIAFGAAMKAPTDPHIAWGDANPAMATDDEIRHAVQLARDNGLKVILKPVVNCDDGTWRAWVKFYRPVTAEERARGVDGVDDPWADESQRLDGQTVDLAQWALWWKDFSAFVRHYAELAAETRCEMFCLGCEMNSTESFESEWRTLIADVRQSYKGLLVYDVNHDREREVRWWDAVDVIGVSAYYQVKPPGDLTEDEAIRYTTGTAEIVAALRGVRQTLAEIHQQYHKPILFIETGVTNVRGCARHPWAHSDEQTAVPLDELEQANYYQAMFDVFEDEPWFAGFCWWDWPARLYSEGEAAADRGFCIYGKQAEAVLRANYSRPHDRPATAPGRAAGK